MWNNPNWSLRATSWLRKYVSWTKTIRCNNIWHFSQRHSLIIFSPAVKHWTSHQSSTSFTNVPHRFLVAPTWDGSAQTSLFFALWKQSGSSLPPNTASYSGGRKNNVCQSAQVQFSYSVRRNQSPLGSTVNSAWNTPQMCLLTWFGSFVVWQSWEKEKKSLNMCWWVCVREGLAFDSFPTGALQSADSGNLHVRVCPFQCESRLSLFHGLKH